MKIFKRISLIGWIMIAFVAGTSLGIVLSECCTPEQVKTIVSYFAPFGNVLVAMLKMVVFPIIFFSLFHGASSMPLKKSGKVGGSVIMWYFCTSVVATIFGVFMAMLLNPSMDKAGEVASGNLAAVNAMASNAAGGGSFLNDFVVGLFQNPFAALSNGQFLSIIVFAVLAGLAARSILDEGGTAAGPVQALVNIIDGAQQVAFKIVRWVIYYFPIGVFALTTVNFAENGTLLFGPYLRITVCVIVGVTAMIGLVYPLAIAIFCRENPYKVLRRIREPLLTAFVTRSSAATLPVSFRAMDNLGVSRKLSSFSLPMGATINMDGVCVHLPVFVILAANIFGHAMSFTEIATLCLSIMFASIGTGGIPGGSVFLLFMVLETLGLTPEQVTLITALALGINPILDMFETCCNVAGDNVCTYIVAKKSGLTAAEE